MKTKAQKYKKGIDYHLQTGSSSNHVYWEFEKAGSAASSGRVWTLVARVVLDPNVARDEYEWEWVRAVCSFLFLKMHGVGEVRIMREVDVWFLGSDTVLPSHTIDHDRSARPSSTRRGARWQRSFSRCPRRSRLSASRMMMVVMNLGGFSGVFSIFGID